MTLCIDCGINKKKEKYRRCKSCIADRRNRPEVKAKRKEYKEKYYQINKERILLKNTRWKEENRALREKTDRKWVENNRDKVRETKTRYKRKNEDKTLADKAKRRAIKINAKPVYANLEKIREFYKEAKNLELETGIKYHVDHIIPLQGKTVCGFHIETNLQVITAEENMRKGNKYEN